MDQLTAHLEMLRHSFNIVLRRGEVGMEIETLPWEFFFPSFVCVPSAGDENILSLSPRPIILQVGGLRTPNVGRSPEGMLGREHTVIDSDIIECMRGASMRSSTSKEPVEACVDIRAEDMPQGDNDDSMER